MRTIEFWCDRCDCYREKLPVVGWVDGAGYVIVSCPKCKSEHATLEAEECDS